MDNQELNACEMIWSYLTEEGVGPVAGQQAQIKATLKGSALRA